MPQKRKTKTVRQMIQKLEKRMSELEERIHELDTLIDRPYGPGISAIERERNVALEELAGNDKDAKKEKCL